MQEKKRIDLPTYKEMFEHARALENDAQSSLTPHTSHYLHQEELDHKKDCVQIYKEVIYSKRLQELGWKPLTTFKEGMKNSFDFYANNGYKW